MTIDLRLAKAASGAAGESHFSDFDAVLRRRKPRPTSSTASVLPAGLSDDERLVTRQALGGMLWSKQYYHYVVEDWLAGIRPGRRRRRSAWKGATAIGGISSRAT